MTQPFRVYDSDFTDEAQNELINLAAAVALTYNGNWAAMIEQARHCRQARPLDTKQARQILNMALSDVEQAHHHAAIRNQIRRLDFPTRDEFVRRHAEKPKPKLTVVRDEPRVFIKLNAKFNSNYFRPNHKMGKVHRIDHARTFMEWKHPYDWDRCVNRYDIPKMPRLIIYGWCGKRYDDVLKIDERPESTDICARCQSVERNPGIPPGGRIRVRS